MLGRGVGRGGQQERARHELFSACAIRRLPAFAAAAAVAAAHPRFWQATLSVYGCSTQSEQACSTAQQRQIAAILGARRPWYGAWLGRGARLAHARRFCVTAQPRPSSPGSLELEASGRRPRRPRARRPPKEAGPPPDDAPLDSPHPEDASLVEPHVPEDLILFPPGTVDDPRSSRGFLAPRAYDGGPVDLAIRTAETALMASISVILYLLMRVTNGSLPLDWLFCTPLLTIGLRWGARQAWMSCGVTALLMFACLGPQSGIRYMLETGMTSMVLIWALRANVPAVPLLLLGSVVDLAGQIGQILLLSLFLDADLVQVVVRQGEAILQAGIDAGLVPDLPESVVSHADFVRLSVLCSLEAASLSFTAASLFGFWSINAKLLGFRVTSPPRWLISVYPADLLPEGYPAPPAAAPPLPEPEPDPEEAAWAQAALEARARRK